MRHPRLFGVIAGSLLFVWTSVAFAWNDIGHITVARIAYSRLTGEERTAVFDILKQHPHYDLYFKKPEGLDIPEDEYAFLRASTWSDFIRPPRGMTPEAAQVHPTFQFHRGPWHYVNFPFQPGHDTSVLPPPLIPTESLKTNILEQLQVSHDVLSGKLAQDPGQAMGVTETQNRAVRMCWLLHLVGDLHQPMHAVAMVNKDLFPGPNHGDNGGNFIMIRINAQSQPSNLHAYWDNLLGFSRGWRDGNDAGKLLADVKFARDKAELFTHNPAFAPEKLEELATHRKVTDWALESFQLATSIAYDNGKLKFVAQQQLQEKPELRDSVPVLPPVLQEKAHAGGNRRVTLAGYRLAEQIQTALQH